MNERLNALAAHRWPRLAAGRGQDWALHVGNVVLVVCIGPLAVVGLVWLLAVTDWHLIRRQWVMWITLLSVGALLRRWSFFVVTEVKVARYNTYGGSLDSIMGWSAALIFGPSACWLAVLQSLTQFAYSWWKHPRAVRWSRTRNLVLGLTDETVFSLVALHLYQRWGGVFPLPGLARAAVLPAVGALLLWALLSSLPWLWFFVYLGRSQIWALTDTLDWRRMGLHFAIGALIIPALLASFALLPAAVYTGLGVTGYFFLLGGLLLVSVLAYQLSKSAERSRQQTRAVEGLEALGRALLAAPPDAAALPTLLQRDVPRIFPFSDVDIRVFPDQQVLAYSADHALTPPSVWTWLQTNPAAHAFPPGAGVPWSDQPVAHALVVAPILDMDDHTPVGGIVMARHTLQYWDSHAVHSTLPSIQTLAAQIAAALHRARAFARTLAHEKVRQELVIAGQIQTSFLPRHVPQIAGWQIAAALEPAQETSGDFYDWIALPDGCWGIVVADVAGKGVGPALYMALSRTLIRTYAVAYPSRPDLVLTAANRRILADTSSTMFVTVFYAVLDPHTATLTYCNAGHNPPYLFRTQKNAAPVPLGRTGIPLGIEEREWQHQVVHVAPGDLVVLYTDGLTEAQNEHGALWDTAGMLAAVPPPRAGANAVQQALLQGVHTFVGDAPQADDLTLVVLTRDA